MGGGSGRQVTAILERYPAVRGVLFDQPHIVADSRQYIEAAGVAGRCELVGGSFFESVPSGGDAYLLQSILHDWYDADCLRILAVCRAGMGRGARLIVVERILEPPNEGRDGKFSDLNMFVAAGGQERTNEEWRTLLAEAGFEVIGRTPAGAVDLIEAAPV